MCRVVFRLELGRHVRGWVAPACLAFAVSPPFAARADELGSVLAGRAVEALQATGTSPPTQRRNLVQPGWTWAQLQIRDETYPLTVDIVGSNLTPANKVIVMLAGGSTNFESSFFTPNDRNLAQFFADHGYLVIGVSPREDNVPNGVTNYRFMEPWGLQKHSADVRSIVEKVRDALGLPYEILGHSYGAITALDYAVRYTDTSAPERVIALDIYSLDPLANPTTREDAGRTYQAHVQLLQRGEYVDTGYALLKPAAMFARSSPMLDSGMSRSDYGHSGTFTFEGLLFATLMDSSKTDGVHTSITGLPGDWLFKGGLLAGRYVFADNARNDRYAFTRTRYDTMLATTDAAGSGLISVALERDVWAVNAGDPAYPFDWGAIRQPVIWINTEFGYGVHRYGAQLIRDAGNPDVVDSQILGYAHGDILWGETAHLDLWEQLVR